MQVLSLFRSFNLMLIFVCSFILCLSCSQYSLFGSQYLLFCRLLIQVSSIFQLNAHFCLFIHSLFALLSVFFVCPALSSYIAHVLNIDGSSICSGRFVIRSSSTQHFKLSCSLLMQVSSRFVSFNFSSSLCSFAPSPSIYVNN